MNCDIPTEKLVVISDIHANARALDAVLSAVEHIPGIAQIICLGDIVGFHTQPSECIDMIRKHNIHCISGNHDAGVAGRLDAKKFPKECWEAIEWTRKHITDEDLEFLMSLPTMSITKNQYWMMHGVLGDLYHYMNRDWKIRYSAVRLWLANIPLGFFGHTHQQSCIRIRGPLFSPSFEETEKSNPISLDNQSIYLLNPGTVGQPRTDDSHARFAVIDLNTRLVHFEKIHYDYSAVIEKTLEVFPGHASLYKRFGSL